MVMEILSLFLAVAVGLFVVALAVLLLGDLLGFTRRWNRAGTASRSMFAWLQRQRLPSAFGTWYWIGPVAFAVRAHEVMTARRK